MRPIPDIVIDHERQTIHRRGNHVRLDRKTFQVFMLLYGRMGRPVRRDAIYDHLYQLETEGPWPDIIAVFVSKIRKLIAPLDLEIRNDKSAHTYRLTDGTRK